MDRRRFLAGASTAGALSLAGCAALGDTTDANALFVSEGSDRYFSFTADGTEVATAGVRFWGGTTADGPVPFKVWAERERDASFTEFRLELTHENRNGDIYMEPPNGRPWPAFRYAHTDDRPGTLVEITDFGAQAASTLTLGFLYEPRDEQPRLGFDVSFALGTSGVLPTTWRCTASRNLEIPAET